MLKTSVITAVCLTSLLAGCAADGPGSATDEGDLSKGGSSIVCDALGTNEPTLIDLAGPKATLTRRGSPAEAGVKVADPAPGFAGYYFASDQGAPGYTLWVSNDHGKVELHDDNVGPHWDSSCHGATAKELSTDACALRLREMGAFARPANVTKLSDAQYQITSASQSTGDYVWTVKTTGTAFGCQVNMPTWKAVSCAAVVFDKISARARDDGSSAGMPYVKRTSGTSNWTGGIHDPESGDFAYDVQTDSLEDHCKVQFIHVAK